MIELPNNSTVAVHDIFDELPKFMYKASTLFCDIPYNQSLLTNFSCRDGVVLHQNNKANFNSFLHRLFDCIQKINPGFLFLETGKEALADCVNLAHVQYKYITFYNSTYYHNNKNKCYIIHATNTYKMRRYNQLEDMDESDVVAWICANHKFDVIGDLLMGKGLVGREAYKNHKTFVGTEINEERLMELVKWITKKELKK